MCLAVPTKVVRITGEEGEAEIGGVSRRISLAFTPEARVGDYVLVHAGFAISVLDEESAWESLELFEEMEALRGAQKEAAS
jgi:hydrogenase expression/formation protein HypC